MTKEQLVAWLVAMTSLTRGLKGWMIGPLGFVKGHLEDMAIFFESLTSNDFVLELIIMLINQGKVSLPKKFLTRVPKGEIANLLTNPSRAELAQFRQQASEVDPSV